MGKRRREDAATLGDLEDLAEAIKSGFHEAFGKGKGKGNRAPAPDPVDDDDGDDDGDDGDDGDDHAPPWSLSKTWFGEH